MKKLEIPRAREGVNLKKPEPRARKARFETQKRPRPKPRAQYTKSIILSPYSMPFHGIQNIDNIPESGYTESKERRCQQTVARMIKLKK